MPQRKWKSLHLASAEEIKEHALTDRQKEWKTSETIAVVPEAPYYYKHMKHKTIKDLSTTGAWH